MKSNGALSWIPHSGVNDGLCILGRYVLSKFLRSRMPPYLERTEEMTLTCRHFLKSQKILNLFLQTSLIFGNMFCVLLLSPLKGKKYLRNIRTNRYQFVTNNGSGKNINLKPEVNKQTKHK